MVVDANIERSLGFEGLEVKRWPRVLKNLAHTRIVVSSICTQGTHNASIIYYFVLIHISKVFF
jgi:hypothetical protein